MAMLNEKEKLEKLQENLRLNLIREKVIVFFSDVVNSLNKKYPEKTPFAVVEDSDGVTISTTYTDMYGFTTDFGHVNISKYGNSAETIHELLERIEANATGMGCCGYESDLRDFLIKEKGDGYKKFIYYHDEVEQHFEAGAAIDRIVDFCVAANEKAYKEGYITKKELEEGFPSPWNNSVNEKLLDDRE